MIFLAIALLSLAQAEVRVAIIDTGVPSDHKEFKKCVPPVDLTGFGVNDVNGHGSNIAHIIKSNSDKLGAKDVCYIFIKFYHDTKANTKASVTAAAVNIAIAEKADVINLSFGGSTIFPAEQAAVIEALEQGIVVVAAAGNGGLNFDKDGCNYYPACYHEKIIVVGNGDSMETRNKRSNYGKQVDIWTSGTSITAGGYTMSGTSQAAAITTGKVVGIISRDRNPASQEFSRAAQTVGEIVYLNLELDRKLNEKLTALIPKKYTDTLSIAAPLVSIGLTRRVDLKLEF